MNLDEESSPRDDKQTLFSFKGFHFIGWNIQRSGGEEYKSNLKYN